MTFSAAQSADIAARMRRNREGRISNLSWPQTQDEETRDWLQKNQAFFNLPEAPKENKDQPKSPDAGTW